MFKKVNIFFFKKSFIVIFLIGLFQSYNLDYKFDGMSCVGLALFSIFTCLLQTVFYIFCFIYFQF
jgi:hypothetical protein